MEYIECECKQKFITEDRLPDWRGDQQGLKEYAKSHGREFNTCYCGRHLTEATKILAYGCKWIPSAFIAQKGYI